MDGRERDRKSLSLMDDAELATVVFGRRMEEEEAQRQLMSVRCRLTDALSEKDRRSEPRIEPEG
jgi:hypothetical protein